MIGGFYGCNVLVHIPQQDWFDQKGAIVYYNCKYACCWSLVMIAIKLAYRDFHTQRI